MLEKTPTTHAPSFTRRKAEPLIGGKATDFYRMVRIEKNKKKTMKIEPERVSKSIEQNFIAT